MPKEYIEREAVLRAYEEEQRRRGPWRFEKLIASIPAADVAPVVHGRWLNENNRPKTYERICTACGGMAYFCGKGCSYKYCPNCGAKMEKE